MSISLHEKSYKNKLTVSMLYWSAENAPDLYHGLNMLGARGEPDRRKVLTATELPRLGDELCENKSQLASGPGLDDQH